MDCGPTGEAEQKVSQISRARIRTLEPASENVERSARQQANRERETYRMTRFLRESAKGIAIAFAVILVLEVGLRLVAFGWYHSEYYLFYGIHSWIGRVGINPWATIRGEHYKFPPNYILKGADGQGSETAAVNSHGFRG